MAISASSTKRYLRRHRHCRTKLGQFGMLNYALWYDLYLPLRASDKGKKFGRLAVAFTRAVLTIKISNANRVVSIRPTCFQVVVPISSSLNQSRCFTRHGRLYRVLPVLLHAANSSDWRICSIVLVMLRKLHKSANLAVHILQSYQCTHQERTCSLSAG